MAFTKDSDSDMRAATANATATDANGIVTIIRNKKTRHDERGYTIRYDASQNKDQLVRRTAKYLEDLRAVLRHAWLGVPDVITQIVHQYAHLGNLAEALIDGRNLVHSEVGSLGEIVEMGFYKNFYPRPDKKIGELVFVLHTEVAGVWDREYCNAQDVWEFVIGGEFDKVCDLTFGNISTFLVVDDKYHCKYRELHASGELSRVSADLTKLSFELREKILHTAAVRGYEVD